MLPFVLSIYYHDFIVKYKFSTQLIASLFEKMQDTLLWENQNPSVGFAAQKITLDLSKYTVLVIAFLSTELFVCRG